MSIYRLGKYIPQIHPTAYIADNATIIGNVIIEANASIWYNVTIRADNDLIVIGENSNVQDGSVLHADPGHPLILGKNVTVGHMVMLHGCTIKDNTMIGIRATILNGSVIEENCLVGAGSLVTENKTFGPDKVLMGAPARAVKSLDEDRTARMSWAANHYLMNKQRFLEKLEPISQSDALMQNLEEESGN